MWSCVARAKERRERASECLRKSVLVQSSGVEMARGGKQSECCSLLLPHACTPSSLHSPQRTLNPALQTLAGRLETRATRQSGTPNRCHSAALAFFLSTAARCCDVVRRSLQLSTLTLNTLAHTPPMGFITRDSVALITGGSRGIGLGMARGVMARGGRVIILDLEQTAGEVRAMQFGMSQRQ